LKQQSLHWSMYTANWEDFLSKQLPFYNVHPSLFCIHCSIHKLDCIYNSKGKFVMVFYFHSFIPSSSHLLPGMLSSCAHLLNIGFSSPECLFTTWERNDSNFAQIRSPSPDGVDVADHIRWFSHGSIHSERVSHSFSLLSFDRTLWTSM